MIKNKEKKEYILEYDMIFANVLSILLLIMAIAITGVIIILFKLPNSFIIYIDDNSSLYFGIFFIIMIFWMVLHEIIHGIAYQVMGAKSENIVFGAAIEKGVFYCKCKEYIDKKCIMFSLISPFILIGIVTYIIGFIIKSPLLIILSIINISGASGDLMMFNFFLKQDDDVEFKELGFSSPFVLRTSKDLNNKKYLGIKSIKEVKDETETKEGSEKKVHISKASWIFIIVMLVLLILLFVLQIINNNIDKSEVNENYEVVEEDSKITDALEKYDGEKIEWNVVNNPKVKEIPGVIFRRLDGNIVADDGMSEKNVFTNFYSLKNVFLYDLTSDNVPEIIASFDCCNGVSIGVIEIYDWVSNITYIFTEEDYHNYYLYSKNNKVYLLDWDFDNQYYVFRGSLKLEEEVIDGDNSNYRRLTIKQEEEL